MKAHKVFKFSCEFCTLYELYSRFFLRIAHQVAGDKNLRNLKFVEGFSFLGFGFAGKLAFCKGFEGI